MDSNQTPVQQSIVSQPTVQHVSDKSVVQITKSSSPFKYILIAIIIIIAGVGGFAYKAYKGKATQSETQASQAMEIKPTDAPLISPQAEMKQLDTSDTGIAKDIDTINKNLNTLDQYQQELSNSTADKQDSFTDL